MQIAIGIGLEEDSAGGVFGCISGNGEWLRGVREV